MHITEGILSPPILITGALIAAGGVSLGLAKTKNEDLPKISLLAATFYLASLIHVPIGPTSSHLMLSGLLGILLSTRAAPAILIALFLQFLTFQHGGLTTLGVNWTIMALPAITLSYLFRKLSNKKAAAFICGFLSIIVSSSLLIIALLISGKEYKIAASVIFLGNLPVAIVEGLITMVIIQFLLKARPEVVPHD